MSTPSIPSVPTRSTAAASVRFRNAAPSLVAQHLAGAPLGGPPAQAGSTREPARTVAWRLANRAIPDAVSTSVTLAVHLHPIGTIAGLGTRLIRSRIQGGRDQADAFHRLSQDLGTLRAQSDG
jgi:hypothetical protein